MKNEQGQFRSLLKKSLGHIFGRIKFHNKLLLYLSFLYLFKKLCKNWGKFSSTGLELSNI